MSVFQKVKQLPMSYGYRTHRAYASLTRLHLWLTRRTIEVQVHHLDSDDDELDEDELEDRELEVEDCIEDTLSLPPFQLAEGLSGWHCGQAGLTRALRSPYAALTRISPPLLLETSSFIVLSMVHSWSCHCCLHPLSLFTSSFLCLHPY